jgi:hypothetical protein
MEADEVEHALDRFEYALFLLPTRRVLLAAFFREILVQRQNAVEERGNPNYSISVGSANRIEGMARTSESSSALAN